MSGDALVNTGAVEGLAAARAVVTVRRMQTKLHGWASADSSRRFDDLYNLVYDPAFLMVAWERVAGNNGARTPGIDRVSVAKIKSGKGVEAFLDEVRELLQSRTFRPVPVRQVMIPKSNGKLRQLGIPTVADRVVQAALKLVLEPSFEADFQSCSYGFRPNRFDRRMRGKNDRYDAYSAAEAVCSGRATAVPKGGDGLVEVLRVLRTARFSAVAARTATINQIKGLLVAGLEPLRARYRGLSTPKLIQRLAATRLDKTPLTAEEATAYTLRLLARRWQDLNTQVLDLTGQIRRLLDTEAPELMAVYGCGPDTIAQLLITAGDNPDRLRSEAAFATLAGVAPIPASSGKTNRHRLSRAGDRQANSALFHIALVRMRYDPQTQAYLARRTAEGKTRMEIIRCLKRYIARQLYPLIVNTLHPHKQLLAA